MSKFKILLKITGSIAAYKSAILISKLVQNNCEVKTVVTKSALEFIGKATLEGLTNNLVYDDTFEAGKMMSHIELDKWADLTIVVPADANTINKFAAGISDNLLTSLFLAHDRSKPYLIAPAMNSAMLNHPATQKSLSTLEGWGIKILPTDIGQLACGDVGAGKLLDVDKIYGYIFRNLNKINGCDLKILITNGGTKESIDNTRFIGNLSTGATASSIADYYYENGADITLLKSDTAISPKYDIRFIPFDSFSTLESELKNVLSKNNFDIVIHAAAVSDFSPQLIEINGIEYKLPLKSKLQSSPEEIKLTLTKNIKLIDRIKLWSKNPKIQLVAFKFLDVADKEKRNNELEKIFTNSGADYIVFNSPNGRVNNVQYNFELINSKNEKEMAKNSRELSKKLLNTWRNK